MEDIRKELEPREFSEFAAQIKGRFDRLRNHEDLESAFGVSDDIVGKSNELEGKYGKEVEKYELYHAMIGSTLRANKELIGADFPDKEDSIEAFLGVLEKKYGTG